MIKFLILINLCLGISGFILGCSESEEGQGNANPDINLSGEIGETEPADPLKQLQDAGRLPPSGEGRSLPVLPSGSSILNSGGPEVLSLYPVEVDPDQDGVPDVAIVGRPEVKLDNCPGLFNLKQEDSDNDGVGDACDH